MSLQQELIAILLGFIYSVLLLPFFIGYQHYKKEGQSILEVGPKWHASKNGTATMGGLIFISGAILASLVFALIYKKFMTPDLLILIFVLFSFSLIGFFDDALKVYFKRNLGLTALQKSSLQIFAAIIFVIVFVSNNKIALNLTFFNTSSVIVFSLFALIWLVGFSNAVNLTDGLDGLVSGLSMIALGAYGYIAYIDQRYDILAVILILIGSILGFFFFNYKPAKIFMGDVGSLGLGAVLAAISLLLNRPLSLVWIGIVFVIETISVMIQVGYFKKTGKRIFKMTPIHHHFEMSGWGEWRIDVLFWFVGFVAAISYIVIFV